MSESTTIDVGALVDAEHGFVSASVYSDEAIYQLELERIFARCWLFLTARVRRSRSPATTSTDYMGEDPVLVVRQKDGSIAAFLNQCRHRGMRICRADAGNARTFTCTYHGWTYDLGGGLVAVPHEERAYRGALDRGAVRRPSGAASALLPGPGLRLLGRRTRARSRTTSATWRGTSTRWPIGVRRRSSSPA